MNLADSQVHVFGKKLEKLPQFAEGQPNSQHHNLFKEFFSTQFSRNLASVKEARKIEFAEILRGSVDRFSAETQQPYLHCLVSFFLHGKDSEECQLNALAAVEHVFKRVDFNRDVNYRVEATQKKLDATGNYSVELTNHLAETTPSGVVIYKELQTPAFTQVWKILSENEQNRLTISFLEKVYKMDSGFDRELAQELQRCIISKLDFTRDFVGKEMDKASNHLVKWLRAAGTADACPMVLGDLYSMCLQSHNLTVYRAVQEKQDRERFLLLLCLTIMMVTSFHYKVGYLTLVNPNLRLQAYELQQRYFSVKGNLANNLSTTNIIMHRWIQQKVTNIHNEIRNAYLGITDEWRNRLDELRAGLKREFIATGTVEPISPGSPSESKDTTKTDSADEYDQRQCLLPRRKEIHNHLEGWVDLVDVVDTLEKVLMKHFSKVSPDWAATFNYHLLDDVFLMQLFQHYGLLECKEIVVKIDEYGNQVDSESQIDNGQIEKANSKKPVRKSVFKPWEHTRQCPLLRVRVHNSLVGATSRALDAMGDLIEEHSGDSAEMYNRASMNGMYPNGKGGKYPNGNEVMYSNNGMGPNGMYANNGGKGGQMPWNNDPSALPWNGGKMNPKGKGGLLPWQQAPPPILPWQRNTDATIPKQANSGTIGGTNSLASPIPKASPARPKAMTKEDLKNMHAPSLVDLLVKEAMIEEMERMEKGMSAQQVVDALSVVKLIPENSFSIAGLEVTFRTENAQLFVWKSASQTRNILMETWLKQDLQNALVAKGAISAPKKATNLGATGIQTRVVPEGEVQPVSTEPLPPPAHHARRGVYFSVKDDSGAMVTAGMRPLNPENPAIGNPDDPRNNVSSSPQQGHQGQNQQQTAATSSSAPPPPGSRQNDGNAKAASVSSSAKASSVKPANPSSRQQQGSRQQSQLPPEVVAALRDFDDLMADQRQLQGVVKRLVDKEILKKEWKTYCINLGFKDESTHDPRRHTKDTLGHFMNLQLKKDCQTGEKDLVNVTRDLWKETKAKYEAKDAKAAKAGKTKNDGKDKDRDKDKDGKDKDRDDARGGRDKDKNSKKDDKDKTKTKKRGKDDDHEDKAKKKKK